MKAAVKFNSNRNLGQTGSDFLAQVLVRDARNDICQFWKQNVMPSKPPCFSLILKPLPESFEPRHEVEGEDERPMTCEKSMTCEESIKILKEMKLLSEPNWTLDREVAERFCYYECSASILDENSEVAVYPEKVQAICAVGSKESVRAMACAPATPDYATHRKHVFTKAGACFEASCFACSNLEYSSSILVNNDERTCDTFFIPLGFRRMDAWTVTAMALELLVERDQCNSIYIGRIDPRRQPVEVDMRRFRDTCNLVQLDKKESKLILLERFRGRLT